MTREDGDTVRVGGPHVVRECEVSGDLWVGLKGAVACCPDEIEHASATANAVGFKRLKAAMQRACCNPDTVKSYMERLAAYGYDTPVPEDYCVWRLTPSRYDPRAADGAKGGTIYPCHKSPPMLCTDEAGHCWVAQDGVDTVMRVDVHTGSCEQLTVPHPLNCRRMAGPAIARAPDGSVWLTLLGADNALVRILPTTQQRVLYRFGAPAWAHTLRLIHLCFSAGHESDGAHRIYALASDLLDEASTNALFMLRMWVALT
jgi:hypothetical protein